MDMAVKNYVGMACLGGFWKKKEKYWVFGDFFLVFILFVEKMIYICGHVIEHFFNAEK
jgi:hypothetical protein